MQNPNKIVDIIIPVYAGVAETLACIQSVCETLPKLISRAEVVVIYDAGPEVALRDELLQLASQQKITLLINETNQGFVRCINKGIRRSENDVLLLNSDTVVANDWLDRMVNHAYTSSNVATVTPFSNNAEICSFPQICQSNNSYESLPIAEIDSAFAQLRSPAVDIPTAVGFCMFVKRECIDRIGVFDSDTFGRGYGEENDFCMRSAALNYRHVLATDVYVHHHGGISFGDEKWERVQKAIAKLDKMYPSYNALVAKHIEEDPARKWRFAAELILKRQRGLPMILHVSHGIGGGTDRHVVELAKFCSSQMQHAMLVPQANCMRLVFPNVKSGGLFEFPFHETRELKNFLFALSLSRVHVHHVKGWESQIFDILKLLDVPYDITLHDYYLLHTNPTLADKHGYFCEDVANRDEICAEFIPFPKGVDGEQWRKQWKSLLNRAERVIAPSHAAAAIYNSYHPSLPITCAYHPDNEHLQSYPAIEHGYSPEKPFHVAVIGAISVIKGANILERVSLLAEKADAPIRFTLIGYAYKKLASSLTTTGAYQETELASLLADSKPDAIWFPCTWPETYSYTLSAALEAGLPVICPDLGAFTERLQHRPATWVEDWQMQPAQWLTRLLEIREECLTSPVELQWSNQPKSGFQYRTQYKHPGVMPDIPLESADKWMSYWLRELPEQSRANRRIYRALIWLNSHRLFGHVANLIPMWVRRGVKRKLSTRPIHE